MLQVAARRVGRSKVATNVGLAGVAVLLMVLIADVTGTIPINQGRGWDGEDYYAMMRSGWDQAGANPALRPLVVWINTPAYLVTDDVLRAFQVMNYVWVAVLAFAVCALVDRYDTVAGLKLLLVVNLFACIATVKYAAFYPLLVDLGAMAVVTATFCAVLSGNGWLIAAMTIAAVLSREFAIATVAFGIVRDLRLRCPWPLVIGRYGPAMVAFLGWRWFAMSRVSQLRGEAPLSAAALAANLDFWRDPVFVVFFLYFVLTIFGGISLAIAARPTAAVMHCRREPEWAVYLMLILGAAALGSADLWRYLAYLLPGIVVLFAVATTDAGVSRRTLAWAAIVCGATLMTQRPWEHVDLGAYFRNWFPYYVHMGRVRDFTTAPLWPLWTWRLLAVAGLLGVLCLSVPRQRRAVAVR